MDHAEVSVVVNCYQMAAGPIPARFGCRVVKVPAAAVDGLVSEPVHFASCSSCFAATVVIGVKGASTTRMHLGPKDQRAVLFADIIKKTEHCASWESPLSGEVCIVGLVNIHGATKMSEVGCRCFNCGK
ncbi:unknown [Feldmannia species virus]|uniref:Uncharacterized protein n=1 Tax=Feldmannia species virus TaxID=39420 RepID=B5LWM6_9PHYC|nr:hypothetical protein FeldSpV_gp137 [Feldmannia species virus]ACH46889.1 unknown [Feldmannia species virus]